MTLPLALVGRFEQHLADAVESLLAASLHVPGNPEGYALFREDSIRATLSTNPRAEWATQTYGVSGQPADALRRVVEFFNRRGVPARILIVPGALTPELADALSGLGLRQIGFHAILWSPLPISVKSHPPVDIREVSTPEAMDVHIDIQLGAYGVPLEVIDRLRPLRQAWLGLPQRRLYLAWVDGQPAAQAILHCRDDIAYLESAGTLPAYRRRGLQRALIRRRIADATKLGCRVIIGGADFENDSRTNQMACGLTVAYLAAIWSQRPEAMLGARLRSGERVVDLGAGTGLLALGAHRRVTSSGYIVAVDLSADALSECGRQAERVGNVAPQAGIRELYRVLKPTGRASIFEPINEVQERVQQGVRASGFYDELQPEWNEIRAYYDAHKEGWWGTLVGWDERELIGWFQAAAFSSVDMTYEVVAGVRTTKRKKADVAAGIRGRPNPNMPSYEEVARLVLGHRADRYLDRYAQFLISGEGPRSASAAVYLVAKR